MKSNTRKLSRKFTLATLSAGLLAAVVFSGCESTGGRAGSGTHNMDSNKQGSTMPDRSMPGGR